MGLVLYGARGTGSGIVEAACAELGLDVELRDLDARNHEQRGDAYAALNPARKMPTLELDGEVLTESVAIVFALDERHPGTLLPPPATPARAQAMRWMVYAVSELYPLVEIIDYPERFAPSPEEAPAVADRADAMWRERWRPIEAHIAGAPWFLDRGFSAVDLVITVLSRWLSADWRATQVPKVEALMNATLDRPSLGAVWARHVPQR